MKIKVAKNQQVAAQSTGSAGAEAALSFADDRPEALVQRRAQRMADSSLGADRRKDWQATADGGRGVPRVSAPSTLAGGGSVQRQEVKGGAEDGLPATLKSGIESMSGMSMDRVKVHYNSAEPSRLNAHAYAQGQNIYLGPGQEMHLPHEAWHVIQQAQGRVRPTLQMKSGIGINDDRHLEQEADVMGARAMEGGEAQVSARQRSTFAPSVVQRKPEEYNAEEMLNRQGDKQAQGIAGTLLNAPLKYQRYRKLNRIGGALSLKVGVPHIAPVVEGVKEFFSAIETDAALREDTPPANQTIHQKSLEALTQATAPDSVDATPANYEVYSMLGPLDYWLHNQSSSVDIEAALRILRQKMAERPGVSMIAHRGHGPTNRTRGGLIADNDPRRLDHPAENSTSAFKAALDETTTDLAAPKLDGIECDVFLSSDDVPILSHEGKVREQLATAQKTLHSMGGRHPTKVTNRTHIDDLSAAQLQGIRRKGGDDNADSAFITLRQFLDATVPTASNYFLATGKPLRIEIEMKGKIGPSKLVGQSADEADRRKAAYPIRLRSTVAKVISQFKKRHPAPHWEIILFNNDVSDVTRFDELRKQKSHLGLLYTGLGSKNADEGRAAKADELRMAASDRNLADTKHLSDFILTFVPGAERDVRRPNDALRPLIFDRHGGQNVANEEMADTTGAQKAIIDRTLLGTRKSRKVHLLTDIPGNAAHYKATQSHLLAAELDARDPVDMLNDWGRMDLAHQTVIREAVLADPSKYAALFKHIIEPTLTDDDTKK